VGGQSGQGLHLTPPPMLTQLLLKCPSRIPSYGGAGSVGQSPSAAAAAAGQQLVQQHQEERDSAAFAFQQGCVDAAAATSSAATTPTSGRVAAMAAAAAFGTVRTMQKAQAQAGSGSSHGFCLTLAAPATVTRGAAAAMAAAVSMHPDSALDGLWPPADTYRPNSSNSSNSDGDEAVAPWSPKSRPLKLASPTGRRGIAYAFSPSGSFSPKGLYPAASSPGSSPRGFKVSPRPLPRQPGHLAPLDADRDATLSEM
jgi:hypothetical protein